MVRARKWEISTEKWISAMVVPDSNCVHLYGRGEFVGVDSLILPVIFTCCRPLCGNCPLKLFSPLCFLDICKLDWPPCWSVLLGD